MANVYPAWVPPETLGLRIRRLRQAQGWSLRDMAKRGRISAATLSRVERDDYDLNVSSLKAIADILGMDVSSLLRGVKL